MKVIKIHEYGYEAAALGFSLSFNSTVERAKEILPKYAFGISGENKFLRIMQVWLDVDIPRLMWQEADQYKIAGTTLSESTMHTISKRLLNQDDFEINISDELISIINYKIEQYQNKEISILELKSYLPEGFLQRRIWNLNYATIQNIVIQREWHKLSLWKTFINELVCQLDFPEFVRR
jgi:hypothetical protein